MILSDEALASLLTGAVRTEIQPQGLRPWRFSQSPMQRMQPNEAYCLRAEASSGMMLDFETNSHTLEFHIVSQPAAATPWYGLDITVNGRTATVNGGKPLRPARVRAVDLRAGAAMVIAALAIKGQSEIEDIRYIERGYDDIVGKLAACGAKIKKVIVAEEILLDN